MLTTRYRAEALHSNDHNRVTHVHTDVYLQFLWLEAVPYEFGKSFSHIALCLWRTSSVKRKFQTLSDWMNIITTTRQSKQSVTNQINKTSHELHPFLGVLRDCLSNILVLKT